MIPAQTNLNTKHMKAKTILISAIALGVLSILAGCEAQPGALSGSEAAPGKSITSNALVTVTSDGSQQSSELLPPVTNEADLAAYESAKSLRDLSFCEKVSDPEIKKKCNTDVYDLTFQFDAISLNDEKLCDKLSTADLQEACRIKLEAARKFAERSAMPTDQEMNILRDAIASGDIAQCEKVKNPDQRNACK